MVVVASSSNNGRGLLRLPVELREHIYSYILRPASNQWVDVNDDSIHYQYDLRLFRANKQVYAEAERIFRRENVFIRIQTIWSGVHHYLGVESRVPIVGHGSKADKCVGESLFVDVDAPAAPSHDKGSHRLIVLLEDLPTFCKTWFYSEITHPHFNKDLRLTLVLKNLLPNGTKQDPLPTSLQQKLLSPFGSIKNLAEVRIRGEYDGTIADAMRRDMAVPYTSPEDCIEETVRLKDLGNAALKDRKPEQALQLYLDAFEAMHIVCTGRRRSIWADRFFYKQLEGGIFSGQDGSLVRLILRVKLTANVMLAYLKMSAYEETCFWGLRSINLLRKAVGNESDEVVTGFPAPTEMGKIYYRTGVACKATGDDSLARRFFRTALAYLPYDEQIKKDLASVALRLG